MTNDQPLTSERQASIDEVKWRVESAMRELTGNVLRVIRGAGRPYELFDQVRAVAKAIESSTEDTRVGHITEAMQEALGDGLRKTTDQDTDFREAFDSFESGALRAVAARILQQPLQVHAGTTEMRDAFLQLESRREAQRRQREAGSKPVRPSRDRIAEAKRIVAGGVAAADAPSRWAERKPAAKQPRVPASLHTKPVAKVQPPAEPTTASAEPMTTAEAMRARIREIKGGAL